MTQTPENQANSTPDVVRKVFARDVKPGSSVNTVFRVGDKARHTAKSGKVFLAMTLFDKSGRLDARIFDNVDAAQAAFDDGDYLLVAGKVSLFHGRPQLLVERLEKLDPGPIDEKEFAPPPLPEKGPEKERGEGGPRLPKQLRQRLLNLLDDPAVAAGLEALAKHLERYIDERVEQRLSGGDKPPRPKPARDEKKAPEPKAEHKSGLPKDLAFKPFSALAAAGPDEAPEATPPAEERSSS